MTATPPIAFLSYVRSDDTHDAGRISFLKQRLEGEVKMQTGTPFTIFQDRNDIEWGQNWSDEIDTALGQVRFLIPVVTPSYFRSSMCRKEYETFQVRERSIGTGLILPIYYVDAEEMAPGFPTNRDALSDSLRSRNWADWREHRFGSMRGAKLRSAVAELASTIVKRASQARVEIKAEIKASIATISSGSQPATGMPLEESSSSKPKASAGLVTFSRTVTDARAQIRREKSSKALRGSYYAYTKAHDEVVSPTSLSEPSETLKLLSGFLTLVERARRSWATKSVVANTLGSLKNTGSIHVSILIDNSGSMRGLPIATVATWVAILSQLLQQASIPHEILGFTTRAWKGGKAREDWLSDGRPARPGRVNDLRHIVYKDVESSYEEALANFAIMLREGVLKENIDGEALLWAVERIEKSDALRRLIFVISDGAPVDDSTQSVNPGAFLEDHLRQVIRWIKESTSIELFALGIGHDVSRYYGDDSLRVDDVSLSHLMLDTVANVIAKQHTADK